MSKCPSQRKIPEANNNTYYIYNTNPATDGGYNINYCSNGDWIELPSVRYTKTCPATDGFPETAISKYAYTSCPSGYYGYKSRYCARDGWDVINNNCTPITTPLTATCPDKGRENGAGTGNAGQLYIVPYDSGKVSGGAPWLNGYTYDYCNSSGSWWKQPYTAANNRFCPADGIWNEQEAGNANNQLISCPAGYHGYLYRYCKDNGTWGDSSSRYCSLTPSTPTTVYKCLAEGGWPETPDGTSVTRNCPSGYSGQMTRYCNYGDWLRVNSSGCTLTGTPTRCPANSGFPATEVDNVVKISCPDGYFGTQMRYCSPSGSWSNIYSNSCYLKGKCPADGEWPETVAGSTYHIVCPTKYTGQMSRYCNKDGIWLNINSSSCISTVCHPDNGWDETPLNTTLTKDCPTGYTGQLTRTCGSNGRWGNVNSSACRIKACPDDGIWYSMEPSPTYPVSQSIGCPDGYRGRMHRECLFGGEWDDVDSTECTIIQCPGDSTWPTTNANGFVEANCPAGYSGKRTRICKANGIWEDVDSSNCVMDCPANGVWSQTPAATTTNAICPTGYSGTMTRLCTANGTWGNINSSACVIKKCPVDSIWNQTNAGETITNACPAGYTGTMSRICTADGTWSTVNSSACLLNCPAYDGFSSTVSGVTAEKSCPTGQSGIITRTCNNGVWGNSVSTCLQTLCPADDIWPTSGGAGQTVNADCPSGYTGLRTRTCNVNGSWGNINSSACSLNCPASNGFSIATHGVTREKDCPSGYTGKVIGTCTNGTWDINSTSCYLNCPASNGFSIATHNETREKDCDDGYTGKITGECYNGTWVNVNSSSCELVTVDEPEEELQPEPHSRSYCEAITIDGVSLPRTVIGNEIQYDCTQGNLDMSAKCTEDGWRDIKKSTCKNNTNLIILIVIAVILLLVIGAVVIYFVMTMRSNNKINKNIN